MYIGRVDKTFSREQVEGGTSVLAVDVAPKRVGGPT